MNEVFNQVKEVILQSKTAIVACHKDPDGDALGSMLAMYFILSKVGLEVFMYCCDDIPVVYKFLPGIEKVIKHPPKREFDVLITVDSSALERIGDKKIKAKKIINIDHHPDNKNFGDINCVELKGSVAEIIFYLAKVFDVEITYEMALALYVSIVTDTGNFRYSSTCSDTFKIAKELIEKGVVPSYVSNQIYDTKTIEGIKILAATLSNICYTEDKKILWSLITRDMIKSCQARSDDIIGIIDCLRAVKNPEVVVLFREDKSGIVKVNLRSKGKINVSKIANEFGGGGHFQAAGCELDIPINEACDKVISLILKEINK